MYKKIVSAVSSIITSAILALNCTAYHTEQTASAFELGGLIEEALSKSKTIVLSRGNIVNFAVKDAKGNLIDDYRVTIRNSAGQNAGSISDDYYYTDNNTLGIDNNIEWTVKMKTFGDLIAPDKPLFAKDYTASTGPTSSASYAVYHKYNENTDVLVECNYDSTQAKEMKILSTSSTETTAFTIPANKAGVYVDAKWASRGGEGYYYVGEGSKKYFSEKDMIGKLKVISPKYPISDFRLGVDDTLDYDNCFENPPEYQNKTTEYVKWSMNLSKIFTDSDHPVFNSNGTFSWCDRTCDLRKSQKNSTCIITVTSGACVTVAIPDDNGNIDFYVEKENRKFDAEIQVVCKVKNSNARQYSNIESNDLIAGIENKIFVGTPSIPKTGETIFDVPSGKYTLEFTRVPEGYINPGTVSFNVDQTAALQYKTITLNSASSLSFGDVDGNLSINAIDASIILAAYARESTGGSMGFSNEQEKVADVNKDNLINSSDASLVLSYYSYISTGGTASIQNYIASK
ncbi:MAG: hypothetical protein IJN05_11510 [Ruminococcus sp.]|nr:hypothetical protein [Ruminococcus sp.]